MTYLAVRELETRIVVCDHARHEDLLTKILNL